MRFHLDHFHGYTEVIRGRRVLRHFQIFSDGEGEGISEFSLNFGAKKNFIGFQWITHSAHYGAF